VGQLIEKRKERKEELIKAKKLIATDKGAAKNPSAYKKIEQNYRKKVLMPEL
jgi:hypothetical protein